MDGHGDLAFEIEGHSPRVRAVATSAELELAPTYHCVRLPDGQLRQGLLVVNGQAESNVAGIREAVLQGDDAAGGAGGAGVTGGAEAADHAVPGECSSQ